MTQTITHRTRTLHTDAPQGTPALQIVPILGPSSQVPEYRLFTRDLLDRVKVTEVSSEGRVSNLQIENTLESSLFLMDGQELVGARQNRILNTDVLCPAGNRLEIPVSCVEAGRWRYNSASFEPGKAASHSIRSGKSARVHESLKARQGFDGKQSAIWDEVQYSTQQARCSPSPTAALHDAYVSRKRELDGFQASVILPTDAVGLAVFHGSRFLGLDLFDRYSTLRHFWANILEGYAIDWLMADASDITPSPAVREQVSETLKLAAAGKWTAFRSPGEGCDYRLEDDRFTGSALVWDESIVIHLQIFPKPEQAPRGQSLRTAARPRSDAFLSQLHHRHNPEQTMQSYPLDFRDGHLFVQLPEGRFLLDTGAPTSFGATSPLTLLGRQFTIHDHYMGLTTETLGGFVGGPVAGLLGADVLARFDLLLDAPGGRLVISQGQIDLAGSAVPCEAFMGIPIVTARIAGRDRKMFFDTGAQLSYFHDASLATFPSAGPAEDFYPGFGPFTTDTHRVDVELGNITSVLRCGSLPSLLSMLLGTAGTQGIIGNEIVACRQVGLFPRRRMIVFGRE